MILATTKVRILQYLDFKQIKVSEFYEYTAIKRGLLDSDKLKATVSDVAIAKIIAKYADMSPDWLLTGEGPMLRSDGAPTKPNTTESPALDAHLMQIIKEKDAKIDRLNREIGALEHQLVRLSDKLAPIRSVPQPHVRDMPGADDADPDVNQPAKTHKDTRDRHAQRDQE